MTLTDKDILQSKDFKNWTESYNRYLIYMYNHIFPTYIENFNNPESSNYKSFNEFCIFVYRNSSGDVSSYL